MTGIAFLLLFLATLFGYLLNLIAARQLRERGQRLHSLGTHHALYAALIVLLPTLLVTILWVAFDGQVIESMIIAGVPAEVAAGLSGPQVDLLLSEISSISRGQMFQEPDPWKIAAAERMVALQQGSRIALVMAVSVLALALIVFARSRVSVTFRARQGAERIIYGLMMACSTIAIFTTVGIVLSLVFESLKFFSMVPFWEFLFGLSWQPQIATRADQVAGLGAFGVIPVLLGSILIMTIALTVAVPIGLLTAIYLNEFANTRVRRIIKPTLELLAGVPTVVYGFFAILVVAPALRSLGETMGLPVSPNTAMAAGLVMAVMLIPFISSFADDALAAVPRQLRDGSLALGATRGETMMKVLFPSAIPGIVGGILLAVSRAIGETMIVVMAAGIIATLTFNPLDTVTTVTVQIVTLLIGDTEFDNPKTLAAFALGMMLFVITLCINIFALRIVRKYRELYD